MQLPLGVLILALSAGGCHGFSRRAPVRMAANDRMTWQAAARRLLRPDVSIVERQTLALDLLKQAPAVTEAVAKAVSDRDVEPLLDDEGRAIVEGINAVRRQVTEDLAAEAADIAPELPTRVAKAIRNAQQNPPASLNAGRLMDPSSLRELVDEAKGEISNVFDRIPRDLESPDYEVLARSAAWTTGRTGFEGYEVRRYEEYIAAETTMGSASDDAQDFEESANNFNTLAGYIFGDNVAQAKIAMTVPVEQRYGAEEDTMAFSLPKTSIQSVEDAPLPSKPESVAVRKQRSRVLAARRFPGIATRGEVQRQLDALLEELEADGIARKEESAEEYSVLQFNPPQTLPFLRYNEVAVEILYPAPAQQPAEQAAPDLPEQEDIEAAVDEAIQEVKRTNEMVDEAVDEAIAATADALASAAAAEEQPAEEAAAEEAAPEEAAPEEAAPEEPAAEAEEPAPPKEGAKKRRGRKRKPKKDE